MYSVVGFDGVLTVPSVALVGEDVTIEGNLVGNWVDLWEILQMHGRGADHARGRRRARSTT